MADQSDHVRITLRIPRALHAALANAAGPRSLNAEIITRLERTMEEDDFVGELDKRVEALERAVMVHEELLGISRDRD